MAVVAASPPPHRSACSRGDLEYGVAEAVPQVGLHILTIIPTLSHDDVMAILSCCWARLSFEQRRAFCDLTPQPHHHSARTPRSPRSRCGSPQSGYGGGSPRSESPRGGGRELTPPLPRGRRLEGAQGALHVGKDPCSSSATMPSAWQASPYLVSASQRVSRRHAARAERAELKLKPCDEAVLHAAEICDQYLIGDEPCEHLAIDFESRGLTLERPEVGDDDDSSKGSDCLFTGGCFDMDHVMQEESRRHVEGHRERLSVDLSCARGNKVALEIAATELGLEIARGEGTIAWVVQRDDLAVKLRTLRRHQWLSHIPGMFRACTKNVLNEALQLLGASFWPRTWQVPEQSCKEICDEAFSSAPMTVIVKPDGGAHGTGIALARDRIDVFKVLRGNQAAPKAIVQQYIDHPMLLQGFKWDMRIYVLVLPDADDRLVCFFAREGLVRVCVEPYSRVDAKNIYRMRMHLTNYALSKYSDKFKFGDDAGDATVGGKRLLSAVLKVLEAEQASKVQASTIWDSLRRLVRETVTAMAGPLREAAFNLATWDGNALVAALAREHFHRCFQIIGLDVLLDDSGRPWLLEANNNPSLSIEELRPLFGAESRAQANQLFAASRRLACNIPQDSRPCRCAGHPRPHTHHQCAVDVAVKIPIVKGTLEVIGRAAERLAKGSAPLRRDDFIEWAKGTVFEVL